MDGSSKRHNFKVGERLIKCEFLGRNPPENVSEHFFQQISVKASIFLQLFDASYLSRSTDER